MAAAIQIHELTKHYPKAPADALHKLKLNVESGEVYGFLGANGAGKTTTIRLLLNFIRPSSGSARILGMDVVEESVELMREVGYLAGEVALYPKMTGKEFLDYMSALQPPKSDTYKRELLDAFQAELHKPIMELSKGNRQKLGLIQAFMHKPEVLILDEPTSGLDPLMQEIFYETVRDAKKRGASLFISSHNLSEVQRMCDRVGFIRDGKLLAEQSIAELTETAGQTFDVTFAEKPPLEKLQHIRNATVTPLGARRVQVEIKGDMGAFFRILGYSKVLHVDKPTLNLEDEFLKFYERQEGEA